MLPPFGDLTFISADSVHVRHGLIIVRDTGRPGVTHDLLVAVEFVEDFQMITPGQSHRFLPGAVENKKAADFNIFIR